MLSCFVGCRHKTEDWSRPKRVWLQNKRNITGDQSLSLLEFSEINLFLLHLTCGRGYPVAALLCVSYLIIHPKSKISPLELSLCGYSSLQVVCLNVKLMRCSLLSYPWSMSLFTRSSRLTGREGVRSQAGCCCCGCCCCGCHGELRRQHHCLIIATNNTGHLIILLWLMMGKLQSTPIVRGKGEVPLQGRSGREKSENK